MRVKNFPLSSSHRLEEESKKSPSDHNGPLRIVVFVCVCLITDNDKLSRGVWGLLSAHLDNNV